MQLLLINNNKTQKTIKYLLTQSYKKNDVLKKQWNATNAVRNYYF